MTHKLIHTAPDAKVYFNADYDEFIVKPSNALKDEAQWYFTDDREDACLTANNWNKPAPKSDWERVQDRLDEREAEAESTSTAKPYDTTRDALLVAIDMLEHVKHGGTYPAIEYHDKLERMKATRDQSEQRQNGWAAEVIGQGITYHPSFSAARAKVVRTTNPENPTHIVKGFQWACVLMGDEHGAWDRHELRNRNGTEVLGAVWEVSRD